MIRLKMYGLGGQGVVTAAKILVQAVAIQEGRFAKSLPAYGHERRGAPIHANVLIDDQEILLNTFVYEPDVVMLFDTSVVAKGIDVRTGTHEKTLLVINSPDTKDPDEAVGWKGERIYQVNATQIALHHLKRNIPNSAMLGALAKTGIVGLASIEQAIQEVFGRKAGELNALIAREAYGQTSKF